MVVKTLPYLRGTLKLNLFNNSAGLLISVIFYIQRIVNIISDLV